MLLFSQHIYYMFIIWCNVYNIEFLLKNKRINRFIWLQQQKKNKKIFTLIGFKNNWNFQKKPFQQFNIDEKTKLQNHKYSWVVLVLIRLIYCTFSIFTRQIFDFIQWNKSNLAKEHIQNDWISIKSTVLTKTIMRIYC